LAELALPGHADEHDEQRVAHAHPQEDLEDRRLQVEEGVVQGSSSPRETQRSAHRGERISNHSTPAFETRGRERREGAVLHVRRTRPGGGRSTTLVDARSNGSKFEGSNTMIRVFLASGHESLAAAIRTREP